MKTRMILTTVLIAVFGIWNHSFAGSSPASKHHPRRAEVNHRIANQEKRINTQVKEGELTQKQAAKLKSNDARIFQEEKDMASQNKGHITKLEQKTLNQQLNKNSKKIGN